MAAPARRKDSTSPVSLGAEAHWILSAAGKWTDEDEKEWKREQHRENMVSFRLKKKEQRTQLKTQHRALEAQLKQKLAIQRAAAARGARLASATWSATHRSVMNSSPVLDKSFVMRPLHQALADLVAEKEALRHENSAIASRIHEHMKLQKMIQKEGELLSSDDETELRRAGEATASPQQTPDSADAETTVFASAKGSFVSVDGGGPTFFYEPVTAQDVAATMRKYDERFRTTPPRFVAGSMFGWHIERSLSQHEATGATFSRAWYTKRIHCPRGNALALARKIERDSWSVLVDPVLYAKIHRQPLVSRTLQRLSDGGLVVVRDSFDPRCQMHFRYLNLVARAEEVKATGQRQLNQYLYITDSSANRLARDADPRADVKWIVDGGAFMSFVVVDDETIDVVYDHYTYCASVQQADYFLIEWGNIVVRWEEIVHPARLLL